LGHMRNLMKPSHWDFGIDSELKLVEERLRKMVESEEKVLTDADVPAELVPVASRALVRAARR